MVNKPKKKNDTIRILKLKEIVRINICPKVYRKPNVIFIYKYTLKRI